MVRRKIISTPDIGVLYSNYSLTVATTKTYEKDNIHFETNLNMLHILLALSTSKVSQCHLVTLENIMILNKK